MPGYFYSTIRFVPNPATGEFVNIGAIAGSDAVGDWEVRTVSNHARARKLDPRGLSAVVFERVEEIEALCDEGDANAPAMSRDVLRKLYEESQNIVQFSEPTPIVAASADDALDVVFTHLVIDPERQRRQYRTKKQVISAVLGAYNERDWAPGHVQRDALVRPTHYPLKFDFAVANGRTVQLAQTWSFEIPYAGELTDDIRAWAWAVNQLRHSGAKMDREGESVDVPADVDIAVVYLPPTSDAGKYAWDEAEASFGKLDVHVFKDTDVRKLADRAGELLTAAAE
jgi:hypothetical protein